jgi:DNA-binding CsgD family transcriptional regulator
VDRLEAQVVALVVEGRTNREIAERLRVSERAVRNHLENVRARLKLRGRAHLAAWAATNLPPNSH